MTAQYRAVPNYEIPRTTGKDSTPAWYRFDQAVHIGTPPGAEEVLDVGPSPWSYQAKAAGFVIIDGGTVSSIQMTRNASYFTGQIAGVFPLAAGDILTVTYSVKPTVAIFFSR